MADAPTTESHEQHQISCMEIWGGNEAIDNALSVPGLDAWVHSTPHAGSHAGGDIHFVSVCGGANIARFMLADVAGHGEEVSKLAKKLRGLMRRFINRVNTRRFAIGLNKAFGEVVGDEGRFATAVLTTYYAPNDHLIVCLAGHPPPLWYQARQGRWVFLEPTVDGLAARVGNLPLGIIEPTEYQQFAVPLEIGDVIVLYSDAAVEAANPSRAMLGQDGWLEMAKEVLAGCREPNPGRPSADSRSDSHDRMQTVDPDFLGRGLLAALNDYRGQAPPDDDLTLIVLHHNGAPRRPTATEIGKTVAKMLGLMKV